MDKATEEWLNSQKRSSRYIYKSVWKYFTEFTGLTGDQILESRKADKEYAWEKRVIEFRNWIIEEKRKHGENGGYGGEGLLQLPSYGH